MKEKIKCYENYPIWIVLISDLLNILIYLIGFYIIYQFGLIYGIIYLIYIGLVEISVLRKSCVNCYYYGKNCAFGRGKLACLFFKKGNKNFIDRQITWKHLIPDMLVSIIPIIAGIILLIIDFKLQILLLIIALAILMSAGNAFVRGKLACKYCKQRELGCPALKIFDKNYKPKKKRK